MVEFLTPAFGEEAVKPLPALGVSAQALNYLDFLIEESIQAVALYRSGVLVQVPRPERYAIHKLIVADRRRGGPDQLKSRKDRDQAAFLVAVLSEDRPDELAEAYEDALSRGSRRRDRIKASLKRMPETRARDFGDLAAAHPAARLHHAQTRSRHGARAERGRGREWNDCLDRTD